MIRLFFAALMLAAQAVQAQIGLPNVRLPALPPAQLPNIDRTLSAVDAQNDPRVLQEVRRLRVRDLIRRNRATLEAAPDGAAIVRNELVLLSPSEVDIAGAQAAGFVVDRIRVLDGLDSRVVILRAPPGMSTQRALARLRLLEPAVSADFNHIYIDSGAAAVPNEESPVAVTGGEGRGKLGLIDSGVDVSHPVFKDAPIHAYGCGGAQVPGPHGTAVASLMIGRSVEFHGSAPGSELYAADVYCGLPTGGAVDVVAEAFAWLARERVPVINVSLVGPPNVTLEAVVRMVVARGHLIVAAVGNDGPAAPPLYPASYPGVVGVTAVDSHRRVLIEAARGSQVTFAAPGAEMSAAKSPQGFEVVRGTSFAAPIVAGLLAAELHEPDRDAAARAIGNLERRAIDLGAPGLDPVYGYGLVGADLGQEPRLARVHAGQK